MATSAVETRSRSRIAAFWDSTVGKKIVMGATGVAMVLFVIGHVAGNLQVFIGRDVLNRYGELLRTSEELLMLVRLGLLACVVLHVVAAYQLTMRDRAARPVGYAKHSMQASTVAARMMRIGGVLILVFIPLHLLNFTTGGWHPDFAPGDIYGNMVYAFQAWPLLSVFYVVVSVFVGLHLYHGMWAMLRTLGLARPTARPLERRTIAFVAWAVALGFVSIPVAIVLRIVQ